MMNIRLVTFDDATTLLDWRNDPITRKMSFDQEVIELSDHLEWFEKALKRDDIVLFLAEHEGAKIGVVRFDKNEAKIVVSINLNPAFKGKGLASKVLLNSIEEIRKIWTNGVIEAKIKSGNVSSLKIFEKVGFVKISSGSDVLTYNFYL